MDRARKIESARDRDSPPIAETTAFLDIAPSPGCTLGHEVRASDIEDDTGVLIRRQAHVF